MHTPTRPPTTGERGGEREDGEGSCGMLSSGQDMAVAYIKLSIAAVITCLRKGQASQDPSLDEEGTPECSPWREELLVVDGC